MALFGVVVADEGVDVDVEHALSVAAKCTARPWSVSADATEVEVVDELVVVDEVVVVGANVVVVVDVVVVVGATVVLVVDVVVVVGATVVVVGATVVVVGAVVVVGPVVVVDVGTVVVVVPAVSQSPMVVVVLAVEPPGTVVVVVVAPAVVVDDGLVVVVVVAPIEYESAADVDPPNTSTPVSAALSYCAGTNWAVIESAPLGNVPTVAVALETPLEVVTGSDPREVLPLKKSTVPCTPGGETVAVKVTVDPTAAAPAGDAVSEVEVVKGLSDQVKSSGSVVVVWPEDVEVVEVAPAVKVTWTFQKSSLSIWPASGLALPLRVPGWTQATPRSQVPA